MVIITPAAWFTTECCMTTRRPAGKIAQRIAFNLASIDLPKAPSYRDHSPRRHEFFRALVFSGGFLAHIYRNKPQRHGHDISTQYQYHHQHRRNLTPLRPPPPQGRACSAAAVRRTRCASPAPLPSSTARHSARDLRPMNVTLRYVANISS
jgi:hypothetical protein